MTIESGNLVAVLLDEDNSNPIAMKCNSVFRSNKLGVTAITADNQQCIVEVESIDVMDKIGIKAISADSQKCLVKPIDRLILGGSLIYIAFLRSAYYYDDPDNIEEYYRDIENLADILAPVPHQLSIVYNQYNVSDSTDYTRLYPSGTSDVPSNYGLNCDFYTVKTGDGTDAYFQNLFTQSLIKFQNNYGSIYPYRVGCAYESGTTYYNKMDALDGYVDVNYPEIDHSGAITTADNWVYRAINNVIYLLTNTWV